MHQVLLRSIVASLLMLSCAVAEGGILSGFFAPDITATFVRAEYNSTSELLKLNGFASTLENPTNTLQNIYRGLGSSAPGSFSLNASIDGNGDFGSGDFEITGTLNKADVSVTLLKGTLTEAFTGAFASNQQLEFKASNLTGDLSSLFDGPKGTFGIRVSNLNTTTNTYSFMDSFASPFFATGVADVGRAVPEPGTAFAFCLLLGAGTYRIRKRKRSA